MGDIRKAIIEEMESRYARCMGVRGSPSEEDMQEAAEQIGESAFVDALMRGDSIKRCRNCGKLFVAKNSRECYCNRPVSGNRTCKDVGANAARKSDPINNVMDKARRLHLYRQSAAGKTEGACKRYRTWERFALKCERECRSGDISIDRLQELIGRNYTDDFKREG